MTSAVASGRNISLRQRDRMVGSTRAGAWLTSRNSDCCGGSSRTFSSALAALGLSSSTVSTMQTRQPSTAAVEPKNEMVSRVSSTVITVRITPLSLSVRSSVSRPPWAPAATWRATGSDGSTRSVSARCTCGASGIAMREHEPRHPIGQRRLADALRAADQPGMRNTPAAIGVQQRRLGLAMPEQRGGLARMRDGDLRFDLTGAHAELAALPAAAVKKRSRKAAHTLAATVSASALASISTQRCGSAAAICR